MPASPIDGRPDPETPQTANERAHSAPDAGMAWLLHDITYTVDSAGSPAHGDLCGVTTRCSQERTSPWMEPAFPTGLVEQVGVGIQNIVAWRRADGAGTNWAPILRALMDGSGSCQLWWEDLPGASCSCVAEAAETAVVRWLAASLLKAVVSKGGVGRPNGGGNLQSPSYPLQ